MSDENNTNGSDTENQNNQEKPAKRKYTKREPVIVSFPDDCHTDPLVVNGLADAYNMMISLAQESKKASKVAKENWAEIEVVMPTALKIAVLTEYQRRVDAVETASQQLKDTLTSLVEGGDLDNGELAGIVKELASESDSEDTRGLLFSILPAMIEEASDEALTDLVESLTAKLEKRRQAKDQDPA